MEHIASHAGLARRQLQPASWAAKTVRHICAFVLAGAPDPDLLVRTGGGSRTSNFMLWQATYTELYFTPTLWPDFNTESLDPALAWYALRDRRFGAADAESFINQLLTG